MLRYLRDGCDAIENNNAVAAPPHTVTERWTKNENHHHEIVCRRRGKKGKSHLVWRQENHFGYFIINEWTRCTGKLCVELFFFLSHPGQDWVLYLNMLEENQSDLLISTLLGYIYIVSYIMQV